MTTSATTIIAVAYTRHKDGINIALLKAQFFTTQEFQTPSPLLFFDSILVQPERHYQQPYDPKPFSATITERDKSRKLSNIKLTERKVKAKRQAAELFQNPEP